MLLNSRPDHARVQAQPCQQIPGNQPNLGTAVFRQRGRRYWQGITQEAQSRCYPCLWQLFGDTILRRAGLQKVLNRRWPEVADPRPIWIGHRVHLIPSDARPHCLSTLRCWHFAQRFVHNRLHHENQKDGFWRESWVSQEEEILDTPQLGVCCPVEAFWEEAERYKMIYTL